MGQFDKPPTDLGRRFQERAQLRPGARVEVSQGRDTVERRDSLAAGEPLAALALVGKSYLSALAVLVLLSTTPLPELLHGLEHLGAPRYLLMVVQFLYRYLFVISEEAQHMRAAAQAKSASMRRVLFDRSKFGAAAGALGVLFARSYAHADGIHQAMLARGFQDRFRTLSRHAFRKTDAIFVMAALVLLTGARFLAEVWI